MVYDMLVTCRLDVPAVLGLETSSAAEDKTPAAGGQAAQPAKGGKGKPATATKTRAKVQGRQQLPGALIARLVRQTAQAEGCMRHQGLADMSLSVSRIVVNRGLA